MSDGVEVAFAAAGEVPFAERLERLRGSHAQAGRLSYSRRLQVLTALSDDLLKNRASLPRELIGAGLPFLVTFLRAHSLGEIVQREIPQPESLDRFVPVGQSKSLRVLPKGLVGHWIAGNVPLLGMFSWALCTLMGNANVIRLSSRQEDFVSPLLQRLSDLSEDGKRVAEETMLVYFDRDNQAAHSQMSLAADVRIAWGGEDAVQAIKSLPCRWECEDLAMGPRFSLAVIDPDVIDDAGVSRLATDAVFFDQLACSSPQIVFVKGTGASDSVKRFIEKFSQSFDDQSRQYQRHPLDFGETYRIQLDRARVLLEGGDLRRDAETRWTVALTDEPLSQVRCANRFILVAPFVDDAEVLDKIPANVQTVVTCLADDDFEQFTERAAHYGVCRFPLPGEGNHFDVPWDGLPLVSRLTRWVLRSERSSS